MTFGRIQTEVRRRLNELTTVFYSDDDVKASINEGYADLADSTEFYERTANLTTLDRRIYYDLTTILPDTFLSPRRVYNTTRSAWLIPRSLLSMDKSAVRQWELTTGSPQNMWLRGNWWLGLWPRPAEGEIMRVYFTAIPPAMIDDDEVPADLPEEYQVALADYAVADLLSQQRETAKFMRIWADYVRDRDGLKDYVENRTKLAGVHVL